MKLPIKQKKLLIITYTITHRGSVIYKNPGGEYNQIIFQYGFETDYYPLESVFSHTKKLCMTNDYLKNHKINNSFASPGHRPLGSNKTGLKLIIFQLISAESCL